MEPYAEVAAKYDEFADEAEGSDCFVEWGRGVAADPEVIAWVSTLPMLKQQPNLVFAAARWHGVPAPGPYAGLRDALLGDDGSIRRTIMERATQTNEVGRLATLMPAFSALAGGGPVALLEVGASAGLCLYPDQWGYAWTHDGKVAQLGPEPRLRCEVSGPAPLPDRPLVVTWRGGIDLNPLDVRDDDAMAWLTTLVWPEDDERRGRLTHSVEVARADPPRLVRGDLLDELPALVEEAAAHGPVVVFHSAVVVYLDESGRRRFHAMMTDLVGSGACHWVSNESPNVLPEIAATAPAPTDPGFLLAIDGHAVAFTHGHGRWLRWLGG